MRIGFVGCGAIGSCYASYLSRKHEVCVLDTYAPVIESIKKNGILLDECAPGSGTGETVSFRPAMATTDPKEIGVVDLRNNNLSIDDLMESEGYYHVLILYKFQSFKSDARLPNLNR